MSHLCGAEQIRANSAALGASLTKRGYKLVTGGTDNHLVLWDLRPEVCFRAYSLRPLSISSGHPKHYESVIYRMRSNAPHMHVHQVTTFLTV